MSRPGDSTKSNETLLQELQSLPSDFLNSAVKAAYLNPMTGAKQLLEHLHGEKTPEPHMEPVRNFGSLRWHTEQLGGAVGTMVPYFLCNKVVGAVGFSKILAPAATGMLMEGVFRPVQPAEGDFNLARGVNALTGGLTFSVLGHLPGYLKGQAAKLYGVDQPWLVNSFTNQVKRHILSGAAAGVVDVEARSLLSGHGPNTNIRQITESVYGYAAIGGAMHAAGEIAPRLTHGRSINDIVQHDTYLNSRAKLDPVAKELLMDYGSIRVKQNRRTSSQDIYDLFERAKVPEVIEFKECIKSKGKTVAKQPVDVSDLLGTFLPAEKYPYYEFHPTTAYATAFKGYPRKTTGFLGTGFDSVVLKLEDGGALKISYELRPEDLGKRFFDMPILEEGVFETRKIAESIMNNPNSSEWHKIQLKLLEEPNRGISYLIQPEAITEIPTKLGERFRDHMPKIGQDFWNFDNSQLGYHDGRIVLLDYFAVRSKEVVAAQEAAKKKAEVTKPIAARLEDLLQPTEH